MPADPVYEHQLQQWRQQGTRDSLCLSFICGIHIQTFQNHWLTLNINK